MTNSFNNTEGDGARRLEDLLMHPHEGLNTEYKGWLDLSFENDKADIAQALLAMANSGGGYIVLGFKEEEGSWLPDNNRPSDFKYYSQDYINSIIYRYSEPPFHVDVHHVSHPTLELLYPVVVVPGGHKVPIRAKRDGPSRNHIKQYAYYIRRPGPRSEEPKTAKEWDELISRCMRASKEELLESIKAIVLGIESTEGANRNVENMLDEWVKSARSHWEDLVRDELKEIDSNRYSKGFWTAAYTISGNTQPITSAQFLEVLRKVQGHETGWPVWWVPRKAELSPYPYEGMIECWMAKGTDFSDPAHSDFWRASPEGKMYLLRGYQEDSHPEKVTPGTIFDLTIPVWRVGECLLHAERLVKEITSNSASIIFRFSWEGLADRTLVSWAQPNRIFSASRTSRQNIVTSEISLTPKTIQSNLPEVVSKITNPLYEVFDFFEPPQSMFEQELNKMRGLK